MKQHKKISSPIFHVSGFISSQNTFHAFLFALFLPIVTANKNTLYTTSFTSSMIRINQIKHKSG